MIWTSNKRNPKIIGATLRNVNELLMSIGKQNNTFGLQCKPKY